MIKFKCPDCEDTRLECCLDGPHTAPITNIDEEGDFDYGMYESSANVDRFQCLGCGFILLGQEKGVAEYPITRHEEVVEWCKKHCKQE